jgi:hypothetical protein
MVCGIGENQHTGHPPLLVANKIRNRERFLDDSTLETVHAMSVANIQPAQATLFTKAHTGQIFIRAQMAYVQGFTKITKMAKDLIASPNVDATATASESSPSDNMLNYLQKSGASYVCLYHNGKTKELRGNSAKAARTEANPHDLSDELTSLSVVPTADADDASPFHEKSVPLLAITPVMYVSFCVLPLGNFYLVDEFRPTNMYQYDLTHFFHSSSEEE